MNETQQLGGARQSSPLDNEMTYPLTMDEYLLISDNLSNDKFSNLESLLLATGISSLISGIVLWVSSPLQIPILEKGITVLKLNTSLLFILLIYGAISIGCLVGFFLFYFAKKTEKKPMGRLNEKILNHLGKSNN